MKMHLAMKKKKMMTMMTVALLGGAASANLFVNPGFEDEGPMAWWSGVFGESGGAWYWDNNADARSGSDLVAIGFWGTPNTGYWGQTVTGVVAGTVYDFTAWTKTEPGFSGDVYLMVEFGDGGTVLATNYSATLSGERLAYEQIQLLTDPAPADAIEATFQLRASGGVNSAMFDDASVVVNVIPEPSVAMLVGLGLVATFGYVRRRQGRV